MLDYKQVFRPYEIITYLFANAHCLSEAKHQLHTREFNKKESKEKTVSILKNLMKAV